MHLDPFTDQTRPGDTLFRDVLSLALLGFIAVIILLLPHVDPKGVEQASNSPAPGNLIVEITWPDEMNADVDLWVQAPGDIPVGFSNKGGVLFNLLRDDLGKDMDLSPINHETAITRGIIAGEYVIHAHAYRTDGSNPPPIEIQTVVSVKKSKTDGSPFVAPLLYTKAKIEFQGQELTLVRFTLTESGTLVKDSVHSIFKELRTKQTK